MVTSCQQESQEETQKETKKPNIIYILADDLGYGDVSCNNDSSKIHTKNIDELAHNGIRFTDAHSSSAVSTPTRYSLLTGRYNWRTELKQGVTWSYDEHLIDTNRLTVASYLKSKGYNTACIGKWHLGLDWATDTAGNLLFHKPIKNAPTSYGFDYFYGIAASLDIPPYFYIKNNQITAESIDTVQKSELPAYWRSGPIGNDFKHIEVLPELTSRAIDYIDQEAQKESPFFLYFPLTAPHTPIVPTEKFKGKSNLSAYGDFVLMVDNVVKQITSVLDKNELTENTMIVFTSDNGFAPYADIEKHESQGHYPSYQFRGYKADIYEGGHRIPFIVKWPGKIPEGSTSDETVSLTDFFATCAAMYNDTLPQSAGVDSYNLLPVLTGKNYDDPLREATVTHSVNGSFSIRKGKWKLNFCPGSGGWSDPTPDTARKMDIPPVQLYNLNKDTSEQKNLAKKHPEVVEKLTQLMRKYIEEGRSTPGKPQENDPYDDKWKQIEWIMNNSEYPEN